jgi:hypothetical protein
LIAVKLGVSFSSGIPAPQDFIFPSFMHLYTGITGKALILADGNFALFSVLRYAA